MLAEAIILIPKSANKGTEIQMDVLPLVLCKDCIHWDKGITEECENSDSICFHNGRCEPDWFCADGERKDY